MIICKHITFYFIFKFSSSFYFYINYKVKKVWLAFVLTTKFNLCNIALIFLLVIHFKINRILCIMVVYLSH